MSFIAIRYGLNNSIFPFTAPLDNSNNLPAGNPLPSRDKAPGQKEREHSIKSHLLHKRLWGPSNTKHSKDPDNDRARDEKRLSYVQKAIATLEAYLTGRLPHPTQEQQEVINSHLKSLSPMIYFKRLYGEAAHLAEDLGVELPDEDNVSESQMHNTSQAHPPESPMQCKTVFSSIHAIPEVGVACSPTTTPEIIATKKLIHTLQKYARNPSIQLDQQTVTELARYGKTNDYLHALYIHLVKLYMNFQKDSQNSHSHHRKEL